MEVERGEIFELFVKEDRKDGALKLRLIRPTLWVEYWELPAVMLRLLTSAASRFSVLFPCVLE